MTHMHYHKNLYPEVILEVEPEIVQKALIPMSLSELDESDSVPVSAAALLSKEYFSGAIASSHWPH